MDKILLIKIGALGDVVRTTSFLRALQGEVTWVTKKNAFPLLKDNPMIHQVADVVIDGESILKNRYDLVINLDEEPQACDLAAQVAKGQLVGAYSEGGKIVYTDSSAEWFDMGLISRYGKKEADERKWRNTKSYQEIIFGMLGKKFQGEEYILADPDPKKGRTEKAGLIGAETRSGDRWAGKRWSRFPELLNLFKKNGLHYVKFRAFPTLEQFIRHISKASLVVTTDSLALHISLALGKKVVALFTCTSPHEIHGYGRMTKVVSPLLEKYYYSTDPELKSGEAIEPGLVLQEVTKLMDKDLEAAVR